MSNNWHYAKDGKINGPITAAQLKQLVTTGQLLPDDLVWRQDMKDWRNASTVTGLFSKNAGQTTAKTPPPLPHAVSSSESKSVTPKKFLWGCLLFPVMIALLLPAVQVARDAARKAQAERQNDKYRNESALTVDASATTATLSNATSDSSASTKSTQAMTFMEQISSLQGVPMNTPLPRREFDKHGGYFHSPRHYYRVFNQVSYDKWVDAFGEPFGVRKAPYGEHEWEQTFQGRVVYLSGWLKTPFHDKRIKNDKPMVILNAVSVD